MMFMSIKRCQICEINVTFCVPSSYKICEINVTLCVPSSFKICKIYVTLCVSSSFKICEIYFFTLSLGTTSPKKFLAALEYLL